MELLSCRMMMEKGGRDESEQFLPIVNAIEGAQQKQTMQTKTELKPLVN